MAYETLLTDLNEGVLTVTLNRPEKLNAFTVGMMSDLLQLFDEVDSDDAIRYGFGLRWAQMGLFETYRIAGGEAGRFSAFLPGWGHMTSPVLRAIDGSAPAGGERCVDGTCEL